MMISDLQSGYKNMLSYTLVEALLGRRARRFFMGAEIPDGTFKYKSRFSHAPLSEAEKLILVAACGGNTSWHHMIFRAEHYAPTLSNYSGAASGRIFPSAAGFHTSKIFFTDDEGVYVLENRDAPAFSEREINGSLDFDQMIQTLKSQIVKLQDGRLKLPSQVPHIEAHNTWVVNQPGSLLIIPVGDLAQHVILALCYMLQNDYVLYDDLNKCAIPGIEGFKDIVNIDNVWPLTFVEQLSMSELATELSISCYAGMLMLNAMGLGGWLFDGISPFSILGASGEEAVPGLGFEFDFKPEWAYPNVTGLKGIMEGACPPHFKDMRAAVEAVVHRKFGPGGPYHPETPGPWLDSAKVRSAARMHDARFIDCIALQAQYLFDTFGKFPATVPSIYVLTYLQAHHLDLEFYDKFFKPGAYLKTHKDHWDQWHSNESR